MCSVWLLVHLVHTFSYKTLFSSQYTFVNKKCMWSVWLWVYLVHTFFLQKLYFLLVFVLFFFWQKRIWHPVKYAIVKIRKVCALYNLWVYLVNFDTNLYFLIIFFFFFWQRRLKIIVKVWLIPEFGLNWWLSVLCQSKFYPVLKKLIKLVNLRMTDAYL